MITEMSWSVADSYFARGDVSPDNKAVDASASISGGRLRGEAELFEHAKVLPQLGAVLSEDASRGHEEPASRARAAFRRTSWYAAAFDGG